MFLLLKGDNSSLVFYGSKLWECFGERLGMPGVEKVTLQSVSMPSVFFAHWNAYNEACEASKKSHHAIA